MDYPDADESTKETVARLFPRVDGKDICNRLKEMRVELAKANNINYETVECPSTGPCAGTCIQCGICKKEYRV